LGSPARQQERRPFHTDDFSHRTLKMSGSMGAI
jgi:hypothetical protein